MIRIDTAIDNRDLDSLARPIGTDTRPRFGHPREPDSVIENHVERANRKHSANTRYRRKLGGIGVRSFDEHRVGHSIDLIENSRAPLFEPAAHLLLLAADSGTVSACGGAPHSISRPHLPYVFGDRLTLQFHDVAARNSVRISDSEEQRSEEDR
jgi:hypothetical protein